MPYTSDGEFYTAEDVLDAEELAEHYRKNPHILRNRRGLENMGRWSKKEEEQE